MTKQEFKEYIRPFEERACRLALLPFEIRAAELALVPYEIRARSWDESLHPRDSKGKFKAKNVQLFAGKKTIDKLGSNDIIKLDDIIIGRSVGAKAENYNVEDKATGEIFHFAEGSRIQNSEVFAGYGTNKPLHEDTVTGLITEFKESSPDKWQHSKGQGIIDYYGEERKAEVHWFQEPSAGKVKFKIKRWLD